MIIIIIIVIIIIIILNNKKYSIYRKFDVQNVQNYKLFIQKLN